jgi:hypothetical protein
MICGPVSPLDRNWLLPLAPILAACVAISAAMLALNASAAPRAAEMIAAISLTRALNRRDAPVPPPRAAALSCSIFSFATLSISSSCVRA